MSPMSKLAWAMSLLGIASAGLIPRADVPSANGFPNPNDQQLLSIFNQAGGKLPNSGLPTSLGAGSKTALQLIRFNELFECAYFSSLLTNISSSAPGYTANNQGELIKIFSTVLAQEELHAIGAGAILQSAGVSPPGPCKYAFPTTNLADAILLAGTFTDVVLGALQGANVLFAQDGIFGLSQLIASVIGQEGEQNGYYRLFRKQVPSESPFLTYVPAAFAYSALQLFVVPNSCPQPLSDINLPIFPALSTNGGPLAVLDPTDQTLSFSANLSGSSAAKDYIGKDGNGLYLTYTTGQQLPISMNIKNVKWSDSTISFEADFPYSQYVMQGFSHGALTTGCGFATPDAVVAKTLAAPAIIQVRNNLS